jgi:uncharacterized protein
MKLHLHDDATQNTLTGHGAGYVLVAGRRIESSLIVTPTALIAPWNVSSASALQFSDFAEVLTLQPSIVVFGSGARFAFPSPQVLAAFSQARIGFEVMDTPAACRTYNVLMSEGRAVAAALIV